MESSSNDSFLWSDASNSSMNTSSQSNMAQSEEDCEPETTLYNNKKTDKKHSKSKRKKEPESGDDCPPEKKGIKLEPESDIDNRKKNKTRKNLHENNYETHNSVLEDDDYQNVSVKKEQESLMTPNFVKVKKKKKKKHKHSDLNKSCETECFEDPDNNDLEHYLDIMVKEEQASVASEIINTKEGHKSFRSDIEAQHNEDTSDNDFKNYLNLRVKQEQASVADSDLTTKRKKKKKRKSSVSSSFENVSELTSMQPNNTTLENDTPCSDNNDSRKQKKKKIDKYVNDNFSKDKREKIEVDFKGHEENIDNDITLQENDFTCSNIVHSTIINNSTVETIKETKNHVTGTVSNDRLKIDNEYQSSTNISDRIRFEDDDTKSYLETESHKKSSKLKEFLNTNPHLQIVHKIQNNCILTKDDDIWILKGPRGVNLKNLKNTYLSLEGKCKIKIDGQSYDGMLNDDVSRLTVITYQNGQASITNLPLKGCINYRKRIPKAHVPDNIDIENNQNDLIPLPDTKCRHPLFGSNYKKCVKIPAVVAERLQAAKDRCEVSRQSTTNKRRKKDKMKETNTKIKEESNTELDMLNKKRKRKHKEETVVPSKKKKLKQDNTENWESEQAIEENLFNF